LQTADTQAYLQKLGAVSRAASPAEFGAFIAAENRKWSAVAKAAGVKID
jgi:tripartite-type tricarboxylate transporter receptor subunit TctC